MELLWGGGERNLPGPKPALTLDRIVQRAVEIADKNGLNAVTMQNVAKRLGVTTMALYRYVSSKSELVDLMVESALSEPPATDNSLGWRANLAIWAHANLDFYRRHPWALQAIFSSPPFGPNQLVWFEVALRALSSVRMGPAERMAIISLVDDHVRGSAQLLLTLAATPQFGEWYAAALERAGSDERYPRIAELLADSTSASSGGTWNQFDFGLERVLDGIEEFIRNKQKGLGETKTPSPGKRIHRT